ncbi:hypothetical protein IEO21_05956 [Rhodonia placenta]|uniref:Uncharacterized protein n=1 Tax=Rhodonia placenta TaxID=104341 RepID=A0A8H7P0Z7_9APHY|nr:hypothetical protein IEO21_05956 [Postia placenta]
MRAGLAAEDVLTAQRAYMTHCLNFMRRLDLCHADSILESPYVLTRNRIIDRWDADHRCVDWHAIYDTMRLNYLGWNCLVDGCDDEMIACVCGCLRA